MIDPNLIRWIELSVNKFFDTNKGSYALLFEGQEVTLDTAGLVNPQTSLTTVLPDAPKQAWAELHVSTSDLDEVTQGYFTGNIVLTLMGTALYTLDDTLLSTLIGFFSNVMTSCIPVYKYGITDADDDSKITDFVPRGKLRIINWGAVQLNQAQGPLRVKQKSIEQLYSLSFSL